MSDRETCSCGQCPVHGAERVDTKISQRRRAARARFSEFLHEYFVAAHLRGLSLVPSFAAQLGVSETTWRQWANLLKVRSVVGAGDLEALDAPDLVELLEAWLARARARLDPVAPMVHPQLAVLAFMDGAGDLARTVRKAVSARSRGGTTVTLGEWGEMDACLAELERIVREARRAVAAAMKAGAT